MSEVVTRFAPSPTGHLHVGGARTALFNWALARQLGGTFLVRIEDTDQARSSQDTVAGILDDLAWLGIEWDEGPEWSSPDGRRLGGDPRGVGPFHQSERLGAYQAAVERLVAADLAYPAFETQEELDALRKEAREAKRNFRYRRRADFDRDTALARAKNEPHVVRFRMPDEGFTVDDQILGAIEFGDDQLDDFVILKRDGFPTYHLAVVVDDAAMGVTHVLRGQEHLGNTPRHVSLQRALGHAIPTYAHLPVIFNADGSKMSKRDKDKAARSAIKERLQSDEGAMRAQLEEVLDAGALDRWLGDKKSQLESHDLAALAAALELQLPGIDVEDFRAGGYLPDVLVNFLALLGWSPGEKQADGKDLERFEPSYLASHFALERVGKGNARFDRAKLLSFNQETLGGMTDGSFLDHWRGWAARYADGEADALGDDAATVFARAMKPRSATLAAPTSAGGPARFVFAQADELHFDEKAVAKVLQKGEPPGLEQLRAFRPTLEALPEFAPEPIEAAAAAFAETREIGMGKIAQPLRVALTGGTSSPALGDTLALLGRDEVLARIDRCLEACAPA